MGRVKTSRRSGGNDSGHGGDDPDKGRSPNSIGLQCDIDEQEVPAMTAEEIAQVRTFSGAVLW